MALKLITAPAVEPVTLDEAKLVLRVTHSQDDARIERLIRAARGRCELLTGRKLIYQTWEQVLDAFPGSAIDLETPPVSSITSVTYTDTSGADVVLDSGDYTLDTVTDQGRGWLLPSATLGSWPSTCNAANVVRVRFVSGYGPTAASVPDEAIEFILCTVATAYEFPSMLVAGVSVTDIASKFHERNLDNIRIW